MVEQDSNPTVEKAAWVIWEVSGDSELSERHYRHARALSEAGLLIDARRDAVGARALSCEAVFDGIQAGNVFFDDPYLLLNYIKDASFED